MEVLIVVMRYIQEILRTLLLSSVYRSDMNLLSSLSLSYLWSQGEKRAFSYLRVRPLI